MAKFNKDADGNIRQLFEENIDNFICLNEPEKIEFLGSHESTVFDQKKFSIVVHKCDNEKNDCESDDDTALLLKYAFLQLVYNS